MEPIKKTKEKHGHDDPPDVMANEVEGVEDDVSAVNGSSDSVSILKVLGILNEEEDVEKHDASRVAQALRDLFHLLYCDGDGEKADKNKREAQSHGAHASIIQAMAKFETDGEVQLQGCRCISALFYANKGWSIDHCLQIFESHGMALVERIATAAKNFPDSPRVQELCYAALVNLFASSTPTRFRSPQQVASPVDEGT
jgi:hypothetical protein